MVLIRGIEDKMLTTGSSQYLHPDYLQPLPTTLDAKKSPLALLAQTCSNIGKDISANSKAVIPPLEKKDGRTSNEEEVVKETKRSDEPKREQTPPKPVVATKEKPPSTRTPESPRTTDVTTPPSESRERLKSPSSVKSTPVVSLSTSTATTSSAPAGTLPLDSNLYFSHSAAALDPLYASALAAHAQLGLKPGEVPPHLPALSPYVGYAQVKTVNGNTTLVPVCRDPYCANCQLSLRGASLPCPAGCTQCSHDKPPAAHHPLPILPLGLPSALGSFYPSYIPTAHGLPYVCNWVSGSEHCGKRFTTSEELLRHLRTHTTTTEASPLPLSGYSLASSLNPYHGHIPSSLSPNSLHRTYPTSLSPIGHALASSRFHPYKSSLSSLSSLSSSSLPSLPPSVASVPFPGAYYSPYSLYSSRLGAATAP